MLGIAAALIGDKIRTNVERELRGICRTAGEDPVDIDLIAFTGSLDGTLTIGIIPIVGHETVVVQRKQTVLLVPDELAFTNTVFTVLVTHHTIRIDVNEIAVLVVLISMTILYLLTFWSFLCAVINIFYTFKLEFLAFLRAVSVGEVVADIESTVELHVILCQMLTFGGNAVHIVIAHVKSVGRRFAVSSGVCAGC